MKKIRCALYDRVSTDIQVEEGLSLDAQREALTKYANDHAYEIVGYYSDEGLTARKKMQNRKELLRLLNDVKQDKIDLILVTKLDRWFRNIKDYHNTQAILEEHNCNWKTIFEEYDTSTSNGRFAINIMLSVNENECDRCSERIKSVFEYKKRKKQLVSGRPAYGYTLDKEMHLVKDPATRHIVEDAIDSYFHFYSKRKVIDYIQEKYGEESPTFYQIERFFEVSAYYGEMYGIPNYCEPYLTSEQVRIIRATNDSKIYPSHNGIYIFSQLLRCPECGGAMSGCTKKQMLKDGSISCYKRYRCAKKDQRGHKSPCISETVIEDYLLNNITAELQQELLSVRKTQARKTKKNNVAGYRAELERLNTMYQKGRISDEYYDTQYKEIEEKLSKEPEASRDATILSLETYCKRFDNGWQEVYKKLDDEHKRAFWRKILRTIEIDRKTHKICGFHFFI